MTSRLNSGYSYLIFNNCFELKKSVKCIFCSEYDKYSFVSYLSHVAQKNNDKQDK